MSLDIVDGSAFVSIATQLIWLLVGLESLWEGISIDVVLVVKFGHRVAALLLWNSGLIFCLFNRTEVSRLVQNRWFRSSVLHNDLIASLTKDSSLIAVFGIICFWWLQIILLKFVRIYCLHLGTNFVYLLLQMLVRYFYPRWGHYRLSWNVYRVLPILQPLSFIPFAVFTLVFSSQDRTVVLTWFLVFWNSRLLICQTKVWGDLPLN